MAMRVAAVILAAGASTRMGRSKAELPWRGRRWVDHVADVARSAGCEPIVVVCGAHRVAPVIGARDVENPKWQCGQLSSLQCGIEALAFPGPLPTAVVVLTVDRPHLRPQTVRLLLDAHRADPQAIWQPGSAGRRGHPILYPWDVALQLLDLPATGTARDLLSAAESTARRRTLDVDDPAIFANLDTPQDLVDLPD